MSGTRDDEKRVPEEELAEDVHVEPEEELGDVAVWQEKIKKLRDELAVVKKERQEYLDGWQRCKADAVNQRKDLEKTFEKISGAKAERLIEALIPALDSFDMAMGGDAWKSVDAAWRMGVESIKNQIDVALDSVGVKSFGKIGDMYDPALHEVLQEIDDKGEAGSVARIVRRGWKQQDRILRPAHVIVLRMDA